MAKMTDDDLQGVVARAIEDAEDWIDGTIAPERARLTRYYKGEPFGGDYGINEIDGQSKFVSRDVHDVVQMMLPSLMDTFFGQESVVAYTPRTPQDLPMARQATEYANFIIREDNDGFGVFYAAMKDALVRKSGVIKYWWDESVTFDVAEYTGISAEHFALLVEGGAEVIEAEQDEETGLISCEVRKRRTDGRVRIACIPPEEFLINRKAATIADADDVWHRCDKAVSELVALGYDFDEMVEISGDGSDGREEERYARSPDSLETDSRNDPSMRLVSYWEGYIRVDADDDGIAELRHICVAGKAKKIVRNKLANFPQFVDLAPDPEPHTFFGGCPGEDVADIQRVKSQVIRLANDSMAQEVHPREWVVDGQVNMEDLLSGEIGQPVRVRAPGMIGPIPTGNSAPTALQFAQYYDEVRENRTGQTKASAGMDADSLQSTTKAAVEMTRQAAQQRVKLVARIFAERGFKPLFKGILRLITRHQDQARVVQLRNEFVPVDPKQWDPMMDVTVNVGLGLGNTEERMAFLATTLAAQREALQMMPVGNPITSFQQLYNTLDDVARVNGQHASRYWTQPPPDWKPPQPPPPPDPNAGLIEAEKIKAQAKLTSDMAKIKADADAERDKLVIQAITKAIEMGVPAELLPQWGQFISQTITSLRVDHGTQIQGVQ